MNHTNRHTKNPVQFRALPERGFPARHALFSAAALFVLAAIPVAARAATMGYTISMSSDSSLLLDPNNSAVQNMVSQKPATVVATANNNPVLLITNNSTTADISDVKMTLTDPDSVFNALKILSPTSALPQSPFDKSVWGGPSKTIDIVLPIVLMPNQSLAFAVNLGPLGGFPSKIWEPGFQNIFFQTPVNPNTNANLTVTYVDPLLPGDPATSITNVLPSLTAMNAAVTVTSACCSTPSTSVLTTSFTSGGTVPEPTSIALVLLGSLPLAMPVWRKYKRAAKSKRS